VTIAPGTPLPAPERLPAASLAPPARFAVVSSLGVLLGRWVPPRLWRPPGRPLRLQPSPTWARTHWVLRRTPRRPPDWQPLTVRRRSARRSVGSLARCRRQRERRYASCRQSARIRQVHSGRGCSLPAFSAPSSVSSKPGWPPRRADQTRDTLRPHPLMIDSHSTRVSSRGPARNILVYADLVCETKTRAGPAGVLCWARALGSTSYGRSTLESLRAISGLP
jgi:hypothetical protein